MNRKFIIRMALKIVIILILPLSINIEFGQPVWFYYSSILLTLGSRPWFDYQPFPYPYPSPFNLDFFTIGLAIVVCLPGILFNHWMDQQPRDKALKKMAAVAAIVSLLVIYPLMMFIPYDPFMPIIAGPFMIQAISPWVIVVLVILPIMARHGAYLDSDSKARVYSDTPQNLIHEGGIRPGKYTVLAYFLGIMGLCFPGTIYIMRSGIGFDEMINVALLTPIWLGSYYSYGGTGGSFNMFITPFTALFPYFLMFIFSPVFAYSILQYLQMQITRMRSLAYAALSILAPYSYFIFMIGIMPPGAMFSFGIYPVPALLIIGLPILFKANQIQQRETLWEDKQVKMWFDKDGEVEGPLLTPQMRAFKPPATVKVPLTYLIISKLRSLRSPSVRSIPETDPSKADWAKAEDPWQSSNPE